MPLLKHAKKKQRIDVKRTLVNKRVKSLYKLLIKRAKENPSAEAMSAAFKSIDKAAKNNILHKNKAARLKSALSKVTHSAGSGQATTAVKKSAKSPEKKKAAKAKSISNKKPAKKSTK